MNKNTMSSHHDNETGAWNGIRARINPLMKRMKDVPDEPLDVRMVQEFVELESAYERVLPQIYDIGNCRKDIFSLAINNLNKSFKKHNVYLFSNILVILSSDNKEAFSINTDNYKKLSAFLAEHNDLKNLFYNEVQLFSHLISDDLSKLIKHYPQTKIDISLLFNRSNEINLPQTFINDYYATNNIAIKLIKHNLRI